MDTTAVSRRLTEAMARLTGRAIGLFPQWRGWRETAGATEVIPAPGGGQVVVLSPPAENDPLVAATALGPAVARSRASFAHVVVDLAGLPLRHPATLGCTDALVTIATSGGLREEHVHALDRLLPPDRNLGVVLVE
jgi:hypothetical protein